MVKGISPEQIEHAYHLLKTRGPATAYAYMTQAGGIDVYPRHLVMMVRQRLWDACMHYASPKSSVPVMYLAGASTMRRRST